MLSIFSAIQAMNAAEPKEETSLTEVRGLPKERKNK